MTRLRDREAAEDLVQETFLAALAGRDRFTGAASERTWLVAILKNKIIDRIRRAGRERPVQDVAADDETAAGLFEHGLWRATPRVWPPGVEGREFREALDRCLERLPDRLALALRLRDADGLETDEICKILSISATNLATVLYRARARMRQCLDVTWWGSNR